MFIAAIARSPCNLVERTVRVLVAAPARRVFPLSFRRQGSTCPRAKLRGVVPGYVHDWQLIVFPPGIRVPPTGRVGRHLAVGALHVTFVRASRHFGGADPESMSKLHFVSRPFKGRSAIVAAHFKAAGRNPCIHKLIFWIADDTVGDRKS